MLQNPIIIPDIERFANDGMRFSQGCASAPACDPTCYGIQYVKTPARLKKTIEKVN